MASRIISIRTLLFVVATISLLVFAACAAPATTSPASSAEEAPADTDAVEEPADTADDATAEETDTEEADTGEADADASEADATDDSEGMDESGEATTYMVDTEASNIDWYGYRPLGNSESGFVSISEGHLDIADEQLTGGTFTIDMTSITPTSQSGNMLGMLTDHLKSDEFFGVETYPTSTLVLKSAEPTDVEGQYRVVGDLTIKETTEEVEFLTDVNVSEETLEATADIVVDRAVYDVQYGSGSFFDDLGDDLIADEMEITVNLVTTRQE